MNQNNNNNNKEYNRYIVAAILFFVFFNTVLAQRITGTVKDIEDNTTLPFVNIYVKGTTYGVITDDDGKFKLTWKKKRENDSLVFSFVGYKIKTISLKNYKNRSTVYLSRENELLDEVIISKKVLPYTEYLMSKVIKNKKYNDPSNIKKLQFTENTLLLVYLSNLKKEILEKKRFKKDKDAFLKDSDSVLMMPILMTKEVKSHKIDKSKNINLVKTLHTIQEGTLDRMNHTIETTVNQKITQDINFYDDYIDLLGRSFKSPIASGYKSHYRIILSDSATVNGIKHFEFQYYPKNERLPAFDGSFWINSKTYALTKMKALLPVESNINFIKKLEFETTYKELPNNKWVLASQKTNTAFSFISSKKNKKRFFSVQKNQRYTDFQTDFNIQDSLATSNTHTVAPKDSIAINLNQETLDFQERKTIKGIRKLQNNAYFKFIDRFGAMALDGYYNFNKIDLGPYFDFYHKNGIEGDRFSLPLRTSEKMADNFTVGGYLGYGTKDEKFKYGVNAKYRLPIEKRSILVINHFDDFNTITKSRYLEFVRENPYSRGGGNALSVFGDKDRLDYNLLKQQHFGLSFSHETTDNSRYLLRGFHDSFKKNKFNKLVHNGVEEDGFRTLGLLIDWRYSKARNFDQQFFSRIYFGSTKPVYHFTTEIGNNKIIGENSSYSDYYVRLNASVKKKFLFGSSFIKAFVEGGYILGEVPFPLLNNPSGNQDIGLARFNYNLLNPVSFSSDAFVNMHLTFNGGGFLFNRLPLLSSLNIRESMSFKVFYGKFREKHNQFFQLPAGLIELPEEPYMEFGVGVTNIFKSLRVEYVTRLNSGEVFDKISIRNALKLRIEVSF